MSKYVSKKALLEWLKKRLDETQFVREAHALAEIVAKIECGRFDAEQMKNYEDFLQNYEDFQRKYEHYQTEVKRLRAALHKITQIYDDPNLHDLTACHEMNRVAKEALSTTEPTGAERVSLCMECDSETHQTEHCHVCGSKHIIPGINAPEGDGNDA